MTEIKKSTFEKCTDLSYVEFPSSLSYIRENDNCKENRNTPSSLRISVIKSKKLIIYSQIDEEKWISIAEKRNFVKN